MRRDIAALDVFVAATVLTACDNGTTSPPSSPDGATTGAVAALTIQAGDIHFTQVEALTEDFTTSTGMKVNVVQKSESDMNTEFTTQIPTDNDPDLIIMAHDKLGALVANGVVSLVDLGEAKPNFADVAVKAVTHNGQIYGVPYAVESVTLVRNNALTKDEPETYNDMIVSGKTAGTEYPFIIQMDDKNDPYHFYGLQTSFSAPVLNIDVDDEYTSELVMGGSGGTDFVTWLKAQVDANMFSPSIMADITRQAFLDGKAAYMVIGPWSVAAFYEAGMDAPVLSIPSTGSQTTQPFVGVQIFYQSAKPTNPIVTKQFFSCLITPETQEEMQKLGGRVSAIPSVATGSDDQDIEDFAKVAGSGALALAIPAMGSVWNFWSQTGANIVSGTETSAEDWATMVTNINNAIASE